MCSCFIIKVDTPTIDPEFTPQAGSLKLHRKYSRVESTPIAELGDPEYEGMWKKEAVLFRADSVPTLKTEEIKKIK
jgi:hypothetical protein